MALSLSQTLLVVGIFAITALCSGPTRIFINTIPAYSVLETCAELEVSTIVRNMAFGCGDGSSTTSYACFCYESSAKFSSMIGKHVSTACNPDFPEQNSSAIEVFSSYCKLGEVAPTGVVTSASPTPSNSTASPGSGPATNSAEPTGPTSPEPAPREKKTNVAAIAAGVTVPIVVIAFGLAGFLLWRRKNKTEEPIELAAGGGEVSPEIHELKHNMIPVEVEGDMRRAELSPTAPTYELGGATYELGGSEHMEKRRV